MNTLKSAYKQYKKRAFIDRLLIDGHKLPYCDIPKAHELLAYAPIYYLSLSHCNSKHLLYEGCVFFARRRLVALFILAMRHNPSIKVLALDAGFTRCADKQLKHSAKLHYLADIPHLEALIIEGKKGWDTPSFENFVALLKNQTCLIKKIYLVNNVFTDKQQNTIQHIKTKACNWTIYFVDKSPEITIYKKPIECCCFCC